MSRCLLHKSRLEAFRTYLTERGIEHRPGRGDFQVLQVMTGKSSWQVIYDRLNAPEHYTVTGPLEPTVRKFIKETRAMQPRNHRRRRHD